MAEPWIKMRVTLHEHPKVVRIAYASEAYGRTHAVRIASVVGLLHRTWSMADGITVDGVLPGYTREALDALIGVPGWTQSLEAVGWASVTPDGIALCEFTKHNGATAKRRTQEADRQRAVRKASPKPYAPDADAERTPSSSSSISPSSSLSDSEGEPEREAPAVVARVVAKDLDPIPAGIHTDLDRWAVHRREIGKPLGASSVRSLLAEARKDPAAFRRRVDASIANATTVLLEDRPAATNGAPRGQFKTAWERSQDGLTALEEHLRTEFPDGFGVKPKPTTTTPRIGP